MLSRLLPVLGLLLVGCSDIGLIPQSPTPDPAAPTPPAVSEISQLVHSATEATLSFTLQAPHALRVELDQGGTPVELEYEASDAFSVYLFGLEPGVATAYTLFLDGIASATGLIELPAPPAGPFTVLFDNAHAQQAGNADWVIDSDAPAPAPASPSSESDWKGAYSAWGVALQQSGRYKLLTNTAPFTSSSLANADAVVIPEPNKPFTSAERSALKDYVYGGGGLFIMANHSGSDRDNDGWDAVRIWNELINAWDPGIGVWFQDERRSDDPCSNVSRNVLEPVLSGPFGTVRYMGFNSGSLLTLSPTTNPYLVGLVWPDSSSQSTSGLWAARALYGKGRVVFITDSSPADDGTGQSGDELYDSWNVGDQQNDAFHLNATAWLAGDVGP